MLFLPTANGGEICGDLHWGLHSLYFAEMLIKKLFLFLHGHAALIEIKSVGLQ